MSKFFLCGCSLIKKSGPLNILNSGQRREGTSHHLRICFTENSLLWKSEHITATLEVWQF